MKQKSVFITRTLISAVLCIFLFLLLCIFITLLIFRVGNTAVIVRNTDIKEILDDTEIAYYMESQLNGLPFNNSYITLDEIVDFIKSDAVSNKLGEVAQRYVEELSAGNLDYHITTGEVFIISQNLAPELYELFGHNMTEDDFGRFVRVLDDILDFRSLSISGMLEDFGVSATTSRLILSPHLVWAAGVLWILCLLFTGLFHKENLSRIFLFAGIPVLLSGLMFVTSGVVIGSYPELLSDTIYRFTGLAGGLVYLIIRYGIGFSAAGALSIVIYFITRLYRQKYKSMLKS